MLILRNVEFRAENRQQRIGYSAISRACRGRLTAKSVCHMEDLQHMDHMGRTAHLRGHLCSNTAVLGLSGGCSSGLHNTIISDV